MVLVKVFSRQISPGESVRADLAQQGDSDDQSSELLGFVRVQYGSGNGCLLLFFVGAFSVVQMFKGRFKTYEIWNEPDWTADWNYTMIWGGNPTDNWCFRDPKPAETSRNWQV